MERNTPQFLIAAPTSGSGKTTISRGLMALLARKGLKVQPYKCGPDYIDTKFHEQSCGLPSYNLDSFMASDTHIRHLYSKHAANADVCIVEGMMGMFDGYDLYRGSSAEIAKILNIPVVLVVSAGSSAYSAAVLAKGFIDFDPEIKVAGVIFNSVGSVRHEDMLKKACADLGITCFGCIRRNNDLTCSSRYLGLHLHASDVKQNVTYAMKACEEALDIDLLLRKTELSLRRENMPPSEGSEGNLTVWVARNKESFSFMYAEHLDRLHSMGKVTYFDPEDAEVELPSDVDLLYLPGGYPELHIPALHNAKKIRQSIRHYIEQGGRTLAECGGMMYLASILSNDHEEDSSRLVDVLPIILSNRPEDRKLSLGYRRFKLGEREVRGHEFHYTQMISCAPDFHSVAQVYNAGGQTVDTPVFRYKNVIASYTHLYWGELDVLGLFG